MALQESTFNGARSLPVSASFVKAVIRVLRAPIGPKFPHSLHMRSTNRLSTAAFPPSTVQRSSKCSQLTVAVGQHCTCPAFGGGKGLSALCCAAAAAVVVALWIAAAAVLVQWRSTPMHGAHHKRNIVHKAVPSVAGLKCRLMLLLAYGAPPTCLTSSTSTFVAVQQQVMESRRSSALPGNNGKSKGIADPQTPS